MSASSNSALSILIIEDSTSDLHMVEQALARAKIRCSLSSAVTGKAAIEMLQDSAGSATVDLMLLDLSLPDMDGLDVLDQVRELPQTKDSVIVALTGSRDPAIIHMARERGVHALMNKPLNAAHLIGIMNEQGFWVELKR
ncbi:MAG: response regulator [Pseudomonadales bacterium]